MYIYTTKKTFVIFCLVIFQYSNFACVIMQFLLSPTYGKSNKQKVKS